MFWNLLYAIKMVAHTVHVSLPGGPDVASGDAGSGGRATSGGCDPSRRRRGGRGDHTDGNGYYR